METILIKNLINNQKYIQEAINGKIFFYPTDTVYGIGSIINNNTIEKIYNIKGRNKDKPFSIIAPNTDRIIKNFITGKKFEYNLRYYLEKYHGITLLLETKEKEFLKEIAINKIVGVRIIKHVFQKFVNNIGQPFITTSANLSGEKPFIDFDVEIINKLSNINYFVNGGKLFGKPSVIIDINNNIIKKRN